MMTKLGPTGVDAQPTNVAAIKVIKLIFLKSLCISILYQTNGAHTGANSVIINDAPLPLTIDQ
jgi:hypothetical protein